MPRISSKLLIAAAAALAALGVVALILTRSSGGGGDAGAPPASAIETAMTDGVSDAGTSQSARSPQSSARVVRPAALSNPLRRRAAIGATSSSPPGRAGRRHVRAKGTALLGASPIDLDQIAFIQPMGLMIGGHVTPIDHGYF